MTVVSKIWKQFVERISLSPLRHCGEGGGGEAAFSMHGDLELIEVLKRQKPSITYSKIEDTPLEKSSTRRYFYDSS